MEYVIHGIVDGGRRRQALVETRLPEDVVLELGIRPGTLMRLQAYKAYELPKARGIDAESIQERERWSVYDYSQSQVSGLAFELWLSRRG